jgi:hypothetical protein
MHYTYFTFLIILGMLGAANIIIAKKPDARVIIEKFSPYQGWIGVVALFYGVFEVIQAIGLMGMLGNGLWQMLWWVTFLASAALQISLGLLLGVGTVKTFVKEPRVTEKLTTLSQKLAPYQGTLGLISMATGVWFAVVTFLAW